MARVLLGAAIVLLCSGCGLGPWVREVDPVQPTDAATNAQEPSAEKDGPDIEALIAAARRGQDARARTAAITKLGQVSDPQAQATLESLLQDRSEGIRAAAVSALTAGGTKQAVLKDTGDRSWRVRSRVARALSGFPDRDGATAARALLDDPSAEVQREAVAAVAKWPLARAGPILLAAMESRSLSTRKAAAERLAAAWPAAAEFAADAPPQQRIALLEQLQQRFQQQFGLADREALAQAARPQQADAAFTPRQFDRVQQLVQQQDTAGMINFGPGLAAALEQIAVDRQQGLPEAVYSDVLPRLDPTFALLQRLQAKDVAQRRQAAEELAAAAAKRPLPRLAVTRLGQLAATEADQLVWRSVLLAVAADPSAPAARLACAAIGHASPEVRRRACAHLAAHPDPRHVKVLLPVLQDADLAVRCAAVRALGATGRMADTAPLRQLLTVSNEPLRLETAAALVRLGDAAGTMELQRLAYSGDAKVRLRVAQAMGETAEPAFIPALLRFLDDQPAVCRAALDSLPKVAGSNAAQAGAQLPSTTSEQVRWWKQWADNRVSRPSGP